MEFAEHIVHDRLLILQGEHPDTKILRLVFLTELLARKAQQRQRDLIAVLLMILLCKSYRLIIK